MLKGKSVNLRLMREKDLERYYELSQDVQARGDFFPLKLTTEGAMKKRLAEGRNWSDDMKQLLIVDAKDDSILGMIVCFKPVFYQDSQEFGYILNDAQARGKGRMTEAVKLFVDYVFRSENIFRVQLQIETANVASRRVAEKAGFKHEGSLRHALIVRGRPTDIEMYGLTRDDWEQIA